MKELSPGTYVQPREIAEAYGTSTVPIREALLRLAEQGLLLKERHRGFSVRRFHSHEIIFANDALRHLSLFHRDCYDGLRSLCGTGDLATEEIGEYEEPYKFYKSVITAASKILSPHLYRYFCLNMNVVSTSWHVLGDQLDLPAVSMDRLQKFTLLANQRYTALALQQLQHFSDETSLKRSRYELSRPRPPTSDQPDPHRM